MRLFACLWAVLWFFAGCNDKGGSGENNAAALKDSANFTTIQWIDSTNKDFGTIAEGQRLEVAFRFRNAGNKPLVISSVRPSCGCTVAEQPTEPVAPGKEGIIKAVFDSENHTGANRKSLYVEANTKGSQAKELQFTVAVEKRKW